MGYILAGILMIVILAVFIAAAARAGKKPPKGTLDSQKPVAATKPAADEATPDASITASNQQAENARRHTPPA